MNMTEMAINLINAIAMAFGFAGILCSTYFVFSKEKISLLKLFAIHYIVTVITSFIAVSFVPLVLCMMSAVYMHLKKARILHNILSCLVTVAIFLLLIALLDMIGLLLMISPEQVIELRHTIFYNVYFSCIFLILAVLAIWGINIISKKLYCVNAVWRAEETSKKLIGFVLITIVCCVVIISTIIFVAFRDEEHFAYYIIFGDILIAVISFFLLVLAYITIRIISQKTHEVEIKKDKEITELYKNEIQNMYNNVRDFKHDYMKIYSSMSILLKENKIDELKLFFNNEITPLQDELLSENLSAHSITFLEDHIVQGLVYSYAVKAKNTGIDFSVDIRENIPAVSTVSSMDLSRVLGILLDNAFEENNQPKEKSVYFGAVCDTDQVTYIVKNPYVKQPDIAKILNSHAYSTKGSARGHGLVIAKNICDKYDNVFFNIRIQDHRFIGEVCICNESL